MNSVILASIIYVTGTGWISGMCNGNNSMMCVRNLENQAEYKAKWDADQRCQMENGRPLNYTAICNSRCSPTYVPPNSTMTVTCQASCRMQCETK
ncbi:MAG: hypothetical protein J7501_00825 [Bdellovibrio sp.]|nr:hypothetical protein [Bdellovibrio sp.]